MTSPTIAGSATASALAPAMHAGAPMPVPHWAVLLLAVPILWLVVFGAVLAAEAAVERLGGLGNESLGAAPGTSGESRER